MDVYIELQRDGNTPLYIQIYEAYRNAILSGELIPFTRLMSVMQLKRALCVSRNTIEMAYLQLLSEGFILSKKGSGYYVSELDNVAQLDYSKPLEVIEDYSTNAFESLHLVRPNIKYDFKPGSVEHSHFPFRKWNEIAQNVMNLSNHEILMYSDPRGEASLRHEISAYLKRSRGVDCHPDQIVLGAGTQTLINLICLILRSEKPLRIAVEDPGFTAVRKAFEWNGCEIVPVCLKNNALDISELKEVVGYLSAIYLTPSNQHPMGGLLNVSERLNLLNWAKDKETYIIEDDYDSEFRYNIHPVPTMFSLDQFDQVIYMGTFSKTLFPAMHVGYTVLPRQLANEFVEIGAFYNQTASKLHQLTIAEFMRCGLFEKHIRKMRTLYGKKHQKMIMAIQENFGSQACVIGDHAGVNLTLKINVPYSENELIENARKQGVAVYPISFYKSNQLDERLDHNVFLGYGHMDFDEIEEVIRLLRKAWLCDITPFHMVKDVNTKK